MLISLNTKLIGLIGNPLGQSFSSYFQNETLRTLDLDYIYYPIEVENKNLEHVINGMRSMNFAGFAVTKPYKIEVLKYMDELDDDAKLIGSINTVVIENERLKGYNTDGKGLIRSFKHDLKLDLENNFFLSFGAGGTARAVCFELAKNNVSNINIVSISNSSLILAKELNNIYGDIAKGYSISNGDFDMEKIVSNSDILMNFTGLGMNNSINETCVNKDYIKSSHICFDATYNPKKTKFLIEAEEKGATILNGLNMLINQGAIQFQLWTNYKAPYQLMTNIINRIEA